MVVVIIFFKLKPFMSLIFINSSFLKDIFQAISLFLFFMLWEAEL